jgi:hypothetical protein
MKFLDMSCTVAKKLIKVVLLAICEEDLGGVCRQKHLPKLMKCVIDYMV